MARTWLSRRAFGFHITLLVVVGACAFLCWWQLHRALGGNGLSWVYTFEWPFFAGYAVYMWWKLLHEDESEREHRRSATATARAEFRQQSEENAFDPFSEEDPELAAYNRYLASLHAGDKISARGRPGREES